MVVIVALVLVEGLALVYHIEHAYQEKYRLLAVWHGKKNNIIAFTYKETIIKSI
jgi:hypothetical protein